MNIDAFDFELPPERIAQTPLRDRTSSRLMALNRKSKKITHTHFNHLAEWLQPGDTLVFNDSRVLPARLFGVKQDTGAKAEVLLLKQIEENKWEALVRPGKKLKAGSTIVFSQGSNAEMTAVIEEEREMGLRVLRFQYEGVFYELLERLGQMPLPPYIKSSLQEQDRYQTVYAKERGSAAAPTAGLHFTEAYMEQLQQKGIHLAYVTLHVGLDTFRPVAVDKIEEHEMHSEYFVISAETAKLLNQTRAAGGRIIGVGTTSVRVLETAIESDGFSGKSGWTNIFIYPGYSFQAIDAIITNFHLPKSTLLMMVSAFAGKDTILYAYKEAIEQEYRFFSFGDAMIIY